MSKSLNSRLQLGNKTEREQMDLARDHIKKIKFWTEQCREVFQKMTQMDLFLGGGGVHLGIKTLAINEIFLFM